MTRGLGTNAARTESPDSVRTQVNGRAAEAPASGTMSDGRTMRMFRTQGPRSHQRLDFLEPELVRAATATSVERRPIVVLQNVSQHQPSKHWSAAEYLGRTLAGVGRSASAQQLSSRASESSCEGSPQSQRPAHAARQAATPPATKINPFRAEAVRAKLEAPKRVLVPAVSGNSWSVLLVVSALLAAAVMFGYLGRVEETSIAGGVLLVRGGPRPVLSQASGTVSVLEVTAGEIVQAGQSIARIDAAELAARVQRGAEKLAWIESEVTRVTPINASRHLEDTHLLERKRKLLDERSQLKRVAVQDRDRRLEQIEHARSEGVVTEADALGAREAARAGAEELLLIHQQIAEVDLMLNADRKAFDTERDRLQSELEDARSDLAQSRSLLELATVLAPVTGRVESLLATQGQVIASGTVVARIVPDGAVTSAVVFAPVKDAAFLTPGSDANLEFVSFPVSEFGRTPGRVSRVAPDVASLDETASLLGHAPDEPVIRVEIDLLPSQKLRDVQSRLRSGERLIARINTRERRLIALVFDFLRKWYDP